VYYDFEKRAEWQPFLQQFEGQTATLMKTVNRYEQIYRLAAFKFLTASNESVQLGALKLMAETNSKIHETAVIPDILNRLKELEKKARKGVFVP
jgi:hypothetical protein